MDRARSSQVPSSCGVLSVVSSGTSVTGGTISGAVDLLNVGQKVFLTGQLAVGDMPDNFKAFADQLKWTMFDIKLPWSSSDDENVKVGEIVALFNYPCTALLFAE